MQLSFLCMLLKLYAEDYTKRDTQPTDIYDSIFMPAGKQWVCFWRISDWLWAHCLTGSHTACVNNPCSGKYYRWYQGKTRANNPFNLSFTSSFHRLEFFFHHQWNSEPLLKAMAMVWLARLHSSSHHEVLGLLPSPGWPTLQQQWLVTKLNFRVATQTPEVEDHIPSKVNGGNQAPPGEYLQYQI